MKDEEPAWASRARASGRAKEESSEGSHESAYTDDSYTSESDQFEGYTYDERVKMQDKEVARGSKQADTSKSKRTSKTQTGDQTDESDKEELLDGRRRRAAVKRERHHEEEHRISSRHTRGNEPTRGSLESQQEKRALGGSEGGANKA